MAILHELTNQVDSVAKMFLLQPLNSIKVTAKYVWVLAVSQICSLAYQLSSEFMPVDIVVAKWNLMAQKEWNAR